MTLSRDELAQLFGVPVSMLGGPVPETIMFPATDAEMEALSKKEVADEAKNQADKAYPLDLDTLNKMNDPPWDENGNDIDFVGEGVDVPPAPVVAPTALQLDQWDINRGIDCLAASKPIQAAYPGLRMDLLTPERQAAELAMADMHGVAFLMDPQPVQACTDPRRLEFV